MAAGYVPYVQRNIKQTLSLFFLSSSLNIRQDLKLYVVLPVLQHKTFIINLSNRAYLTFTSYTSYQIVHFFFLFSCASPWL